MSKILTSSILLLIIVLAAFLRITNLNNNPPGFYTDEASIGYNAYKILTSARDEHGAFMPFFFKAFGEYKNALAVYPVVPFIYIFGPNEFAVRLTQAVWGILNVILIFYLAKFLWNSKAGLIAAFILATAPWHIHLSRFNIESHNAFIFFIILGSLFFLKSLEGNWQKKYAFTASVAFGLSFYTYFATRIFTPLFLIGIIFFFRNELMGFKQKYPERFRTTILLFLITTAPFLYHLSSGEGFARFQQVSPLKSQVSPSETILKSAKLYVSHLTPRFVFTTGDSDFPTQNNLRHSITGIGLFYKWQLPFFILGILFVTFIPKNKRGKQAKIFLFLTLALYPLGSVVSDTNTPFATRSVIGIIPYTLLTSYGIYRVLALSKSFLPLYILLGATISFASLFYLDRFTNLEKAYMNRAYGYPGFQYGAKPIVQYFEKQQNNYSIMILSGGFDGPQAYINFFSLGKCPKCYTLDPQPASLTLKLIAVDPEGIINFNSNYVGKIVKVILYPDDREAFYIFEARSKVRDIIFEA